MNLFRKQLRKVIVMVVIVCAGSGRTEPPNNASSAPDAKPLPRVLLIGDSISIGYTGAVQKLLKDVAQVSRAPGNNAHSGNGLQSAAAWVGKEKWDVIHFNHGIWDVHLLDGAKLIWPLNGRDPAQLRRRYTQREYREHLEGILKILKPAATTVIFATTTPWTTYGEETSRLIAENNEKARELMKREGVLIDDLHAIALPNLQDWHDTDGVHFNAAGSNALAMAVARSIADALGVKLAEPVALPGAAGTPAPRPAASGTAPAARASGPEAYFERGGKK